MSKSSLRWLMRHETKKKKTQKKTKKNKNKTKPKKKKKQASHTLLFTFLHPKLSLIYNSFFFYILYKNFEKKITTIV